MAASGLFAYYPSCGGVFVALCENFPAIYLVPPGKILPKLRQKSPPNTYNTTQSKIDGDLRKFLHFLFIPHTTRKSKTAKQSREILFCPPSTDNFQICQPQKLIFSFHGAILSNFKNAKLLLIFFTNRALAAFLSARILKKWAQKNRKPFLDFLFRCAAMTGGRYSIFSHRSSRNFIWLSISLVLI